MKPFLPALALVLLLAACGDSGASPSAPPSSTSLPTSTTDPPAPSTSVPPASSGAEGSGCTPGPGALPDGRWYGLVAGVDGTTVSFDLACWFTGDAAARAAAEDGEESPPPNDYYVRNVNPALRELTAAADAAVLWYPEPGDPATETTTTFPEWAAGRANRSFQPGVWVVIQSGVVTDIDEQYTP